jgi:hypothetical protein
VAVEADVPPRTVAVVLLPGKHILIPCPARQPPPLRHVTGDMRPPYRGPQVDGRTVDKLPRLTSLSLEGCGVPKDLRAVATLSSLTRLDLSFCSQASNDDASGAPERLALLSLLVRPS